ncbi:MAG: class A beta-lactamase [Sphingomonadaceae bacterium]
MKPGLFAKFAAMAAFAMISLTPAYGQDLAYGARGFEDAFDSTLGTEDRAPREFSAVYNSDLERQIARLADGSEGRIGVAALDMATGTQISVLGDQRFPMASTSKVAIAATYLEGVEQGRWSMSSEFPLLIPVKSAKYSSRKAPVRKGQYLPASQLIDLMLTRSSNPATDALLQAVGGPDAVNDWVRRAGINGFRLDRDIATLVRDDGEVDPAQRIDPRDSATPYAMIEMLTGLYQGRWLSAKSRAFLLSTMARCRTGKRRIPALLPASATVAHKTGSLNNTSSDIGIIEAPDGRAIAVAIYVTGQGSRAARESRIASIARAIYTGYTSNRPNDGRNWTNSRY